VLIATARAVADIFAPLIAGAASERLALAYLDSEGRLLSVRELPGLEDEAELPVAELLREAVQLGASAVVMAHNHPSGDPRPSKADVEATRALAAAADGLGIRLQDHLIFAGSEIRSMRGLGLL